MLSEFFRPTNFFKLATMATRAANLVLDSSDKNKTFTASICGLSSDILLAIDTRISFNDFSEIIIRQINIIEDMHRNKKVALTEEQLVSLKSYRDKVINIDGFRKIILTAGISASIIIDAFSVRESFYYKYYDVNQNDSTFLKILGAACQGSAFFIDYCLNAIYQPMIKELINMIPDLNVPENDSGNSTPEQNIFENNDQDDQNENVLDDESSYSYEH